MKKYIAIIFLLIAMPSLADNRYITGPIQRDENGVIKRDRKVVYAFRKQHPCPPTGKSRGACYGWSVDHVIPLACGGKDEIENMQWLPNEIKSSAGVLPKDRWERQVYCRYDRWK